MLFILFLFLEPVNGHSSLCSTPVNLICIPPNPPPDPIPANEMQLHDLCPVLSDHLECLHSYDLACTGRSEFTALDPPLYYRRIKGFLDDACEEDGPLHKVLARTLPCIKRRTENSDLICSQSRQTVLQAYDEYLNTHSGSRQKARGYGKMLRRDCLYHVWTTACMLQDIQGECGFLAYEAGVAAITRTQILPDKCDLDIFLELAGQVDDFHLDRSMKEKLKKYFVVEEE